MQKRDWTDPTPTQQHDLGNFTQRIWSAFPGVTISTTRHTGTLHLWARDMVPSSTINFYFNYLETVDNHTNNKNKKCFVKRRQILPNQKDYVLPGLGPNSRGNRQMKGSRYPARETIYGTPHSHLTYRGEVDPSKKGTANTIVEWNTQINMAQINQTTKH